MKNKEKQFFEADEKIITNNGRKCAKEVEPNVDMILVQTEDWKVRYVPVKDVIEVPLQRKVIVTYEGMYVNISIPEDVSLYVCNERSRAILSGIKSDELKTCHVVPMTGYEWEGIEQEFFVLPAVTKKTRNIEVTFEEKVIDMKAMCEFVAFYLADGSCNTSVNNGTENYSVSIKQNVSNEDYVLELFRAIGYEPRVYRNADGNNNYYVYDKQLWNYLRSLGKSHDKHLPPEFKMLNKEYQRLMMRAFIKGDSSQRGEKKFFVTTTSRKLAEDLQEIFLKATGNMFRINVVNSRYRGLPYVMFGINLNLGQKHARNAHFPVGKREIITGIRYGVKPENGKVFLVERNGVLNWSYTD